MFEILKRYAAGEIRTAPLAERDALPSRPGIYIVVGSDGCALYVGRSLSLRRRLSSAHHRFDQFSKMEKARLVWFEADRGCLVEFERALIYQLRPALNFQDIPPHPLHPRQPGPYDELFEARLDRHRESMQELRDALDREYRNLVAGLGQR